MAHAPHPVEKVWSHLKRSLANLAAGTATHLATLARTRLKKMQYTPRTPRRIRQRNRTLTTRTKPTLILQEL